MQAIERTGKCGGEKRKRKKLGNWEGKGRGENTNSRSLLVASSEKKSKREAKKHALKKGFCNGT